MKTIHSVIYSCEEASRKILQNQEHKLSIVQRFRVWLHLKVCDACKRFDIQNRWIDEQLHKMARQNQPSKLSEAQKDSLKKALEREKANT